MKIYNNIRMKGSECTYDSGLFKSSIIISIEENKPIIYIPESNINPNASDLKSRSTDIIKLTISRNEAISNMISEKFLRFISLISGIDGLPSLSVEYLKDIDFGSTTENCLMYPSTALSSSAIVS